MGSKFFTHVSGHRTVRTSPARNGCTNCVRAIFTARDSTSHTIVSLFSESDPYSVDCVEQ